MAFATFSTSLTIEDTSQIRTKVAGETITAGDCVRVSSTNVLVVTDTSAFASAGMDGVALNGAASGQPVAYAPPGSIIVGSGLTPGAAYYAGGGSDEGEVGLFADAQGGSCYATLAGAALSATRFQVIGLSMNVLLSA